MNGDGNGWAAGPGGSRVWGRFGAAGLFLLAGAGPQQLVLLQHRAPWTNAGGTWALPGGACDSHENSTEAALREAVEECSIDPEQVRVLHAEITAGPFPPDPADLTLAANWTYTTVIAQTATGEVLETHGNEESLELRWIPLESLEEMPLMPAFAESLPELRQLINRLIS
ncbi:NUDIX domain-containing protein [Corynebacterium alimapuense]|uniref:NTP pyrophosphohydrolase n=1 Tax=Corynebacterium alimapuense TaxID=1576874 RepID=A0A3M8KA20_9CORY|nr:NUDIX hydrolase [Corynebacterium alimapuense]RNE50061.1 NTP pyrophosphohydrolase [Corynebacterium alimapuense]